tara:strand:+ start:222 stop:701 length:480 start_codon:yes stop_codon:yes gene_type:complete
LFKTFIRVNVLGDTEEYAMKGRPSLSQNDAIDLVRIQEYSCAVCQSDLKIQTKGRNPRRLKSIEANNLEEFLRLPFEKLHFSHKLPRAAGGSSSQNIEIVCANCIETSQKSITLPDYVWKILDDEVRRKFGDGSNIGMRRGRRLRHIILDYVDGLDSEE